MTDQAQAPASDPTTYRCWRGRYRMDCIIQYTELGDVLLQRVQVFRERWLTGEVFLGTYAPEEIVAIPDLNTEVWYWAKPVVLEDRLFGRWRNKGQDL